ncbi:hypothetical protein EP331_08000 [bacterium]|nr:MAG: hypothetical protein EP331_08000 [bacterium]
MTIRALPFIVFVFLLHSCATVPNETIILSQTLGTDLQELHNSHKAMVQLYFNNIKDNINQFIDEVYSPYIINDMLASELKNYKTGEPSLYKTIEDGGKSATPEATGEVLSYMQDFLDIVNTQIAIKRESLLSPVLKQEAQLLNSIDKSYQHALLANLTITNYLISIRKTKEAQQQALSTVGLSGADAEIINSLVSASENLNQVIKTGRQIDIKSDHALTEIEKLTEQIKQLTTKK